MKQLLLIILLSTAIFGQSGKSVLSQAQKDSIIALVSDSLGYATPETYGAVGDGITNDASAFVKALANNDVLYLKANTEYLINSPINVAGKTIVTNGAKILTTYSGILFYAYGSLASNPASLTESTLDIYSNKDTDKGNVVIVDDASIFTASDMILIVCDSLRGDAKIGELATIRYIRNDTLLLDHALYSYYPVNQNPKVYKVNHTTFNTIGWLDFDYIGTKTVDSMALYDVSTNFLTLRYCLNPDVKIRGRDAPLSGIVVSSCLRPNIEVDLKNSRADGLGYGISIADATTDGYFTGRLEGFRHCVSAGTGLNIGISWNNIVSAQAWGGATKSGGTWAFDSHVSVGSIIWQDCFAYYKGVANDINLAGGGVAYQLGAISDEIRNCSADGFTNAVGMRANKERLYVDGLIVTNAATPGYVIAVNWILQDLVLKNIYAPNSTTILLSGVNSSILYNWHFDNIIAERFCAFDNTNGLYTIPKTLEINNATFKRNLDFTLDSSSVGIYKSAFTILNFNSLERIKLNNVTAQGFETVMYLASDTIKSIEINDCTFDSNYVVLTSSNNSIDNLVLDGNSVWSMSTGVGSNNAVVYMPTVSSKIGRVDAINNKFLGVKTFFSSGNDTGAVILTYRNNINGASFTKILWNDINADSLIQSIDSDGGSINGTLIVSGSFSGNGIDLDSLATYTNSKRDFIIQNSFRAPALTDTVFVYKPQYFTVIDSLWMRTDDSVTVQFRTGGNPLFTSPEIVSSEETFTTFDSDVFLSNNTVEFYFTNIGDGTTYFDYQFYLSEVGDASDNIALNGHLEGNYTDGLNDDLGSAATGGKTIVLTQEVGRTGKAQGFTSDGEVGSANVKVFTIAGYDALTSYTVQFYAKRISGTDTDSIRIIIEGGGGYSPQIEVTDDWAVYTYTFTTVLGGDVNTALVLFGMGTAGKTSVFAIDDIYIKEN